MTLQRVNLGLQAYEALKTMILDRRFAPGARITVEQVARELGVSRTPVWEAVALLAREGLVTNIPHRGVYVTVLSPQEILDLYAVRQVTDALAARLAASRMDADALGRMDANLARQDEALSGHDLAAYSALDAEFHSIVWEQCGNRPLQDVLRSIRDRIWPLKVPLDGLLPQLYQGHQRLVEALRARQPAQAEEIIREHVQFIMEAIGKTISQPTCPAGRPAFTQE